MFDIIFINCIFLIDISQCNCFLPFHPRYNRGREGDEVKPTIDVVKKLAQVLGTTASFLMGETEFQDVFKDPIMFKRIADIEQFPTKDRECLLLTVDNFIKATKLNML